MDARAETPRVAAVVLCGGTSRRFGGGDKTAAPLGESTVLGTLLADLPDAWSVVCVGVPRPVEREVTWTREEPPAGGPVAGIDAGLATAGRADVIVLLAGDQPYGGQVAARLVAELVSRPAVDGVAACELDGRPQLLLAAYRAPALRRALAGDTRDRGVYRTLAPLMVEAIDVGPDATLDVDTPADLDAARGRA